VPEMAGRHGIVNGPAQMRFKDVADGERFDGDVFLAFIGIHRSSAADGTVEILNVGSRSFERSAVRFSNADIIHIQRFKTGGIGVDDQAKFANSGLGLDSHAKCGVALAAAVSFEADVLLDEIENIGSVGKVIVRGCTRSRGLLSRWLTGNASPGD